jgi:hypothetical protein
MPSDEVDLEAKPGYEGALTFNDRVTKQSLSVHVTVQAVKPDPSFSYRWLHHRAPRPTRGTRCWSSSPSPPRATARSCASSRPAWSAWLVPGAAGQRAHPGLGHPPRPPAGLPHLRDYLGRQRVDQAP